MPSLTRAASLIFAAACCLAFAGCASSRLSGDALTLGAEAGASEPLTALQAYPYLDKDRSGATEIEASGSADDGSKAFVSRYAVVDGQDKGATLRLERSPAGQDGAWRLRTFLITDAKGGKATLIEEHTIALSDDGGAVLVASTDNSEGVIVEFDPKMLALPADLAQTKAFEQESAMRLPLIDNPKKMREKGSGEKVLELIGTQTVSTRAGEFKCAHVREVFTSDLSMATAVRTTDHWFAPGVGLIARRWEEKVTALGLTVKSRAQAYVVLAP